MPRTQKLPLLHAAVSRGTAAGIQIALLAGENVEARDADGRTALHCACVRGRRDLVELLLYAGADPNSVDRHGWTALHFSAQLTDIGVAKQLLAAGAKVDPEDADGNTPLFRAVFASRGWGELITLLLTLGADPARANRHGISPQALSHTIANYDVRRWFRTADPSE